MENFIDAIVTIKIYIDIIHFAFTFFFLLSLHTSKMKEKSMDSSHV